VDVFPGNFEGPWRQRCRLDPKSLGDVEMVETSVTIVIMVGLGLRFAAGMQK